MGSFGGKKMVGKQWKIFHCTFKQWETSFSPSLFPTFIFSGKLVGKFNFPRNFPFLPLNLQWEFDGFLVVAFSACNKPFKPLGYPSERVRSREGLQKMYSQNPLKYFWVFQKHSICTRQRGKTCPNFD